MPQCLRVEGDRLVVDNRVDSASGPSQLVVPLDAIHRIAVVGGGKAAAGMALAVEEVLGPRLMAEKELTGWVNVPGRAAPIGGASCNPDPGITGSQRAPQRIHLHAARPAGVNEPTPAGVAGSLEILRLVASLGPEDLCLCLISGGGSALMPAPVPGISLADKLAVTRHLSAAGATIEQLNCVRKQLSRIKGGGLLRACHAGRLVSLIISDVLGDPLEVIASGPTVPDSSTPKAAMEVLEHFHAREAGVPPAVFDCLELAARRQVDIAKTASAHGDCSDQRMDRLRLPMAPDEKAATTANDRVLNVVIGNNSTAVEGAAQRARCLGYASIAESAARSEGSAEEVGRQLAERAIEMRRGAGSLCLVSGGEPVVKLTDESRRGLGGRNQQLALAALLRLAEKGADRIALLSGGTDGEDGPTDAAGAFVDADVLAAARRLGIDAADYLERNDAYRFFEQLDALLKTGPTGTNVCDLRILLVDGTA